jgi:orotidine-5'-phosphate decarboxylase
MPAPPTPMKDRLIVALDVPNARAAQDMVGRIGEAAVFYKVGLQLFTAEGPSIVRELIASGRRVFLDLKLHDIPNTVAHAVKSATALGVHMLTVHAGGGSDMLRAAVEAADHRLKLLAVTVLTSMDQEDLNEIAIAGTIQTHVLHLAELARRAGCDAVVSSPLEIRALRKFLGPDFGIVIPGVRPAGVATHDQQRTATPAQTIADGASHIVVGRPITQADDSAQAARAIIEEMAGAMMTTGRF